MTPLFATSLSVAYASLAYKFLSGVHFVLLHPVLCLRLVLSSRTRTPSVRFRLLNLHSADIFAHCNLKIPPTNEAKAPIRTLAFERLRLLFSYPPSFHFFLLLVFLTSFYSSDKNLCCLTRSRMEFFRYTIVLLGETLILRMESIIDYRDWVIASSAFACMLFVFNVDDRYG